MKCPVCGGPVNVWHSDPRSVKKDPPEIIQYSCECSQCNWRNGFGSFDLPDAVAAWDTRLFPPQDKRVFYCTARVRAGKRSGLGKRHKPHTKQIGSFDPDTDLPPDVEFPPPEPVN